MQNRCIRSQHRCYFDRARLTTLVSRIEDGMMLAAKLIVLRGYLQGKQNEAMYVISQTAIAFEMQALFK